MIRRPPRSTLFPYNDALPISPEWQRQGRRHRWQPKCRESAATCRRFSQRRQKTSRDSAAGYLLPQRDTDRKSTRLNSSHLVISYAVFCLKKKKEYIHTTIILT